MAIARFAWGIDIGNRALKAIKLVRGENGLRIDDFEVIEHENVLSNAGDNKEALIQSALTSFVQRHPTKGGVAAISVSGVSSFARFIKLPPVEPKKIPEIVRFEAIQQIPFPLDDVEWSYQLFQSPDSPDVEVGIFAMRRELINQHIKYFTDLDFNVQVVQMNPLAVYNAMYHDSRLKGTTMIVDLGAENTDLIIADGETIWLRSIPIGGNNFTEVLVKSFKLPFAKAEDLKRNANTSKYARQIFQAMRPVFADLVAEIQRSIGFYSSVHRESRIKKILALGGTFRLAGLQKYLQQNLQLEVEKLDNLAAGAPADAKLAATFNQNLLSLVSAYGLAIQAMGDSKITSSLLPMHIRREKMWRDKTKWFGAAAAAFVLGSAIAVGGYYLRHIQFVASAHDASNNDAVLTLAQGLDSQWKSKVESAGADDRLKISNIRSMLDDRSTWPGVLDEVFSALPPLPQGYLSGDIKAITATPRGDRPIILIDKISSYYIPDLNKAMVSGLNGAPLTLPPTPGAAQDPNTPPAGSRGFVLDMVVTTPHSVGWKYVLDTFVATLGKRDRNAMDQYNSQNPKSPKNFYVAKVYSPTEPQQIKDDSTRIGELKQSLIAANLLQGQPSNVQPAGQPPQGMRPGGYGVPTAPVANSDPALLDRLTNEDMQNDWDMKVRAIVVIDPAPRAPVAP
jgi:type IV pilus assembly protein PilM